MAWCVQPDSIRPFYSTTPKHGISLASFLPWHFSKNIFFRWFDVCLCAVSILLVRLRSLIFVIRCWQLNKFYVRVWAWRLNDTDNTFTQPQPPYRPPLIDCVLGQFFFLSIDQTYCLDRVCISSAKPVWRLFWPATSGTNEKKKHWTYKAN